MRMVLRALAAVGLALAATPAAADCAFTKVMDLPVTMRGRSPMVPAKINGQDAQFIVATGAFFSSLGSGAPAQYGLAIEPGPLGLSVIRGVGGETRSIHMTTVKDFTVGNVDFHDVDFLVGEKNFGGATGRLGQNFLHFADVEIDLGDAMVRLFTAKGCEQSSLAYWAGSQPYSVIDIDPTTQAKPHIIGHAMLNGHRIRVEFDTGSAVSILTLHAAAWAGVHPDDPGVVAGGVISGVAERSYLRTWLAPFADFKIGNEEITNFKLLIGDSQTDESADLLIGEDFFVSHRILISNSQDKLYFTYVGGPVFNAKAWQAGETTPAATGSDTIGDAPKDAEGFSRRASSDSARRDFVAASADLTQAIQLSPNEPRYYYERALADEHLVGNAASPPPAPPMADFDRALTLKPDDIAALLGRSALHMSRGEPALAKADLDAAAAAAAGQPDERLDIAEAYARQGYGKEAIAELDQWISAHPRDGRMAVALNGRCHERAMLNQDLPAALADCEAALKLDPGRPSLLSSRGLVYLRLGDFDRAIDDYNAALRLQANDAWALYGRGLAKLRKGLAADGQADLAAAATIRPKIAEEAARQGLTP